MKKSTVNLTQSKQTERVKISGIVGKSGGQYEQQHTYTVIKLVGRLNPKLNETLSEAQAQRLIAEQGTTVNITPKK
jgi:hypothetical protein